MGNNNYCFIGIEAFENNYTHPIVNLIGRTSLPETLALLKEAKCTLSVDTGSIHLAASVNSLSFGIFNGSQYGRFSPYPNIVSNKIISITVNAFKILMVLLFVLHTGGLISRWYISGHAPWSDAYESILYVSWATLAMGIALGRKSDLTLAATTFVTAMLLWIAHQSWVDPAVANLVPVLDSYWLMIHVAVIVGSYGPLTVGMILGIVSLILMIMSNEKNKKRMDLNLKELTIINELALTVGLIMLTIGNFLGGQWANESWGRYWGWDPKETWALISILIYAFVIHTRLVPGLRNRWTFNFLSVVAYASIMMTYFGVNFYLVGLHSYASGAQVITPSFIWYCVIGVILLGGFSYWKHHKVFKK